MEAKEKDKVILKAWTNTATLSTATANVTVKRSTEISVEPTRNYSMPFYKSNNTGANTNPYRWLIL